MKRRVSTAKRRLPPRARSAGLDAAQRQSIIPGSDCPARAHVWGKQAERSEAVGGSPGNVALRTGPDVPGSAQSILYTPFDLPSRVITGTGPSERLTTFDYTADATRVVRRDSGSSRHFVTDLYQRQLAADGSTLEERFRIFAGSRPVAEISRQASGDSTLYFHQDHLGTPQTLSSQAGESFQQEYDPFGAVVDGPSPSGGITRHGFTGHEQDDDLGLTDMGGRIYDPLAARFMSADPILQAPFWSQGLNRWSYVFNDPVNLTDPSGFATGDPGMDPNVSQGIGAAAVLVHSFPVSGSIYVLAQNAGASLAVPALGGIGNIATTIAMNPFGGSSGGTATVAAPTGTPTSAGNRSTGNFAQANSRGQPGPAVQERRFEAPQAAADPSVLPGEPCYSESGHCNTTLFIPLPDGTAFLQMAQAVEAAASAVWRWLRPPPAPLGPFSQRTVGNFILQSRSGLQGQTFVHEIKVIANTSAKEATRADFASLANTLTAEARAAGANAVEIRGVNVVNPGILQLQGLAKDLERAVLEKLLAGDHPTLVALRAQTEGGRLAGREHTGVGFYCSFEVPPEVPSVSPRDFEVDDVIGELQGLAHGAGFVLFVRDGRIDTLEGFSYDEPWPQPETSATATSRTGSQPSSPRPSSSRSSFASSWMASGSTSLPRMRLESSSSTPRSPP